LSIKCRFFLFFSFLYTNLLMGSIKSQTIVTSANLAPLRWEAEVHNCLKSQDSRLRVNDKDAIEIQPTIICICINEKF
jgi:hypothetical protein